MIAMLPPKDRVRAADIRGERITLSCACRGRCPDPVVARRGAPATSSALLERVSRLLSRDSTGSTIRMMFKSARRTAVGPACRRLRRGGQRRRRVVGALAAAALLLSSISAQAAPEGPRPPCAGAPVPAYAAPGAPPAVETWNAAALRGWTPPDCLGWPATPFAELVALAGSFRDRGGMDDILRRFGAVSSRRGIRYWSTTDKAWRVLITEAAALDGPDATRRRRDFSLAEMTAAGDRYFVQSDSRSSGEVVYRMRVKRSGADRAAVDIDNVTPLKWHFVTLFPPGTLKSTFWIERASPDTWRLFSLSGMTAGASSFAAGHVESYVNRAVAMYRHLLDIPTDQEPPLAP